MAKPESREKLTQAPLADSSPARPDSSPMQQLKRSIERVARFPTPVLLTGETGTGKSTVARALHEASPRRNEPFVHVGCAALVDGLLESELYGVARGAFTGAGESREGRFGAAGQGTIFLDEVGELSLHAQVKLLRALEEGTYERVGETRSRRLRARVVAATHVDLDAAVAGGRFRADLFYRLRVVRLEVPPLRSRAEEIPLWVTRAARRASERLGVPEPQFAATALERFEEHAWPGNLRELFHVVEAAAILAESEVVDVSLVDRLLAPPCGSSDSGQRVAAEAALTGAGGNLSLAARRLGIPRSTLRYRLGLDDALSRGRRRRKDHSIRGESRPM